MAGKMGSFFGRFPRVYWVSMLFELFERGSYYSFTPIIYLHAVTNLDVPVWLALQIFTFIWPLQYGIPILSGALVEKVGYRKQILIAFILMTIAYFSISRAFNTVTLIFSVMALGISIGTYKPLISAIVAKVTSSEDRTYAFGIYYWIVNIAAAFYPLAFAIIAIVKFGGETLPNELFPIIFMVGAILVFLNVIVALFVFSDVPKSEKVKTVKDAIRNVKISMADRKFMVLVLLVAGFWALYSMQLTGVIAIIYGYRWVPSWFNPLVYAIFNPMTIVVTGPIISKYIEKVESMRVIIAGVLVYIAGLMVLGFGIRNWTTLSVGIIIMSVGEFMVAPGYYSFTSKLATEDKVSAYIGSTFISTLLGLALGSIILGLLANYFAVTLEMPYFFMGIAISFCLILFVGFLIYYQKWGHVVIERAKKIAEEEEGKKEKLFDHDYKEPILFRLYETRAPIFISLILIPIILFSTFSMGTFEYLGPLEEEVEEAEGVPRFFPANYPFIIPENVGDESGLMSEGSSTTYSLIVNYEGQESKGRGDFVKTVPSGKLLKKVSIMIEWTDEADPGLGVARTNLPDVFELNVSYENLWYNQSWAGNVQGGSGYVLIERNITHVYENSIAGSGKWEIRVTLKSAGDIIRVGPRDNREVGFDDENTYTLTVETQLYSKELE